MQAAKLTSSTNIGAVNTQIVYAASGASPYDGTYFDVNASGNLEIFAPGIYSLVWQSRSWTTNGAKVCRATLDVFVVAGSTSLWVVGQFPTDGILAQFALLLPNLGPGSVDADLLANPDGIATLALDSSRTFPVEIQSEYTYLEDGVAVANNTPVFNLGIVRLGDCFE